MDRRDFISVGVGASMTAAVDSIIAGDPVVHNIKMNHDEFRDVAELKLGFKIPQNCNNRKLFYRIIKNNVKWAASKDWTAYYGDELNILMWVVDQDGVYCRDAFEWLHGISCDLLGIQKIINIINTGFVDGQPAVCDRDAMIEKYKRMRREKDDKEERDGTWVVDRDKDGNVTRRVNAEYLREKTAENKAIFRDEMNNFGVG